MDNSERVIPGVVDAWIAYWQARVQDETEDEKNAWAHDLLFDWMTLDNQPDLVWQFILEAYKRELDDRLKSILAAGPIEDLLAYHGPDFIDRVETLARKDPKFNYILGGVWKNAMTDDVWQRIQSSRNEIW